MASTSDEENVLQENLGRRTRSGRQFVSTLGTPKTTRQSSKKTHVQASEESNMNISPEQQHREKEGSENSNVQRVLIEDGQGVLIDDDIQCIPPDVVEEQVVEEIINFEGDGCVVYKDAEQERPEELELYEAVREEHVGATSELQLDEKSSSFPFGAIGAHSETSDDVADHNTNLDNTSRVENSLLASLAGDNANSLPSVGGGESETDGGKRNFDQNKTNEVCEKMESDDSLSDRAIAEDLNTAIDASDATIVNAEMISEDELPLPRKLEINDAEEVSDEELPAPQRAELPPDAEVISEDELPASTNTGEKRSPSPIQKDDIIMHKKRKVGFNKNAEEDNLHKKGNEQYNPMSPTSESNESPPFEKKTKCEENDYKYKDNEVQHKEKESNKEKDKKKLPDLEKYWRAVKDDPADFTGWTYLLQYVDNESDADAAREAYDAFLTHYPYCYGYWRKYADYEKRKGIKANCNAVFKRGLEAIPLSVDLWIHYISHVKSHYADDVDYIRSQFERAIEACGLEFRSDKLWDAYIKWETEGKNYQRVIKIYDRLLGIPTQGYSGHFDNFQDIINQHSITATISAEEIKRIRVELQESQIGGKTISVIHPKSARTNSKDAEFESKEKEMRNDEKNTTVADTTENKSAASAICETFDDNVKCLVENEDLCDISTLTPDAISSIKDKFISIRRKVHKTTVAAVTARWSFEEGIKRPYFHVKPLERCQLKNWNDYLDFEIEKGNRQRILVLFERCLIACALYDEFWLKMIRYLESQHNELNNIDITRNVFRRACEIHHTDKPSLHLMWSAFEECQNNFEKASEILVNLEKKVPALLQIAYRRINIERRKGDYGKCQQLYKHYIAEAKNKNIAGSLAIKFARFLNKLCNNLEGALDVLRQALERDPANTRVALQMIDLALQRPQVKEEEIVSIMDKFMARENIDLEQKVLFAQRKVEFLEDFGRSAKGLQDAQRALQLAVNNVNEAKKRRECSPNRKSTKDSQPLNVSHTNSFNNGVSSNVTNYNYNANNSTTYYSQQNNTTYPPSQAYDNYYSHWQYGAGYSGYGQWSGYGNYY